MNQLTRAQETILNAQARNSYAQERATRICETAKAVEKNHGDMHRAFSALMWYCDKLPDSVLEFVTKVEAAYGRHVATVKDQAAGIAADIETVGDRLKQAQQELAALEALDVQAQADSVVAATERNR